MHSLKDFVSNSREFVQRFIAKVKHDVNEDEGNPKDKRETLATLKKTTQGRVSHDRVKARSGMKNVMHVLY